MNYSYNNIPVSYMLYVSELMRDDNRMTHESLIQIISQGWISYSLTEKKKMQDLTDKTNTIINQIEKITFYSAHIM